MSRRSQTSVTNKAVAARACHSGLGVIYVGGSSGGGRAAVGGLRVRFTCCAGKITGTRSRGSTSAALGLAAVAAQGRHPWPSGSRVPWGVAGASAGLEDGAQAGDRRGENAGGRGGAP